MTKRTYRALGLALARMMPLFTGDLYVQWNSKESVLEKDETELDAMNINDLERLWLFLCPEFECKGNSVRYVERVG